MTLRRTEGCHGNFVISHVKLQINSEISRQNYVRKSKRGNPWKPRVNVKDKRGSTFTVTRDLSIHCPYFIYARKNYATVEIYRKAILLTFKLKDLHHTATIYYAQSPYILQIQCYVRMKTVLKTNLRFLVLRAITWSPLLKSLLSPSSFPLSLQGGSQGMRLLNCSRKEITRSEPHWRK